MTMTFSGTHVPSTEQRLAAAVLAITEFAEDLGMTDGALEYLDLCLFGTWAGLLQD